MNLRQLGYFRAVVEHHSLAAAADVLHVAQTNLSVAIRQLETEWGVALFDRIGRGLVLTDTGRILFERATQLLGGADAIAEEMRAIGTGAVARVRVGFTATALDLIAPMIARLSAEQERVAFSLWQGEPRHLEVLVEQRQLDFALTHLPVANPSLAVTPLQAPRLMLLARTDDDRWARSDGIDIAALADVALIVLRRSQGTGIFEQIGKAFADLGLPLRMVADCSDMTAVQELVREGCGVALLPLLDGGRVPADLVAIRIGDAPALERFALIHPRGRQLLPAVQNAIALCRRPPC